MADNPIRFDNGDEKTELGSQERLPMISKADDTDYWISGDKIIQTKDLESSLTDGSASKAATAEATSDLNDLNTAQNRADGFIFKFNSVFTITRNFDELTITIPSGYAFDVNSNTLIVFPEQTPTLIGSGGGIGFTVSGSSATFTFYNDITTINEGGGTDFVLARNILGELTSRIPSVQKSLYATNVFVNPLSFDFDTDTTATDPGAGNFKMDNVTPASVTNVYFSKTTNTGSDQGAALLGLSGTLTITQGDDILRYIVGTVGTPVDNATWVTVPITITDSGTIFQSTKSCVTDVYEETEESPSDITRNYIQPTVSASQIELDFATKNEAYVETPVTVNENISIVRANDTNKTADYLPIEVTGSARTVTMPGATIYNANDSRWNEIGKVLTLPVGSYYLKRIYDGTTEWLKVYPEEYGAGGGSVSFGSENEIPITNATTDDFDYDSSFKWDGTTLTVNDGNSSSFVGLGGGSITTGMQNAGYGVLAANGLTEGDGNTLIGYSAGANLTTGDNNTCIGKNTGASITTDAGAVFLGHEAGFRETDPNKLMIDNQDRASEANGRTKSLVYGEFNATESLQLFRINALVELPQIPAKTTETNVVHVDPVDGSISYGVVSSGGSGSIVFSATPTFDLTNGSVQEMPLTGNTVPSISDEVNGGTYIITFATDGTGGYSISPDSTFGTKTDNSIADITSATASAIYIYTIVVRPGGQKFYTIESIGD